MVAAITDATGRVPDGGNPGCGRTGSSARAAVSSLLNCQYQLGDPQCFDELRLDRALRRGVGDRTDDGRRWPVGGWRVQRRSLPETAFGDDQ